ncbi:acyl carrier protein [Solwaraspora sp. WMMD791]|uniref:acyl carrier protein n=1 Tax=Solwaraspora sp. WMMD791 TaxID=3016086 RepID=UPI00249A7F11|nr:acyl carrier protein [Solwaraspora sp. WMMD791]WFE29228.1 acyl carrier protein [Solwaraspora sp. WMMD791]
MPTFTVDDLGALLGEVAGEATGPGPAAADTSYADLGYDSLALLEVSVRVRQTLGVEVPEAAVAVTATPAQTVAQINEILANPPVSAA